MNRWQLPNGQIVVTDMPFSYNGIQYPANWIRLSSPADRAALGMVELPDPPRVDERFYYVNSDGTVTQKPMPVCRNVIKTQLASVRWSHESEGIIYNNVVFATDEQSRVNYIGALLQAQNNPGYTTVWKAKTDSDPSDTVFVTLDANSLFYITGSGIDYISKCFVNEESIRVQIDSSLDLNELLAIDLESGWPTRQY